MEKIEQKTNSVKMRELVDLLNIYNYHYYVLDKPMITNIEYDTLIGELTQLEESENIKLVDSPNRKIGIETIQKFNKVKTGQKDYSKFHKNPHNRQKGKTVEYFADDYCCIDIETTGFSPTNDRITEIGIIKVRNGVIVDTYDQLINPGMEIPKFIEKLTGITNEMVLEMPTITEVLYEVKNFIGNDILIGYNILSFDSNFLYDNFLRHCEHIMSNDLSDAYLIAQETVAFWNCPNCKLNTIAKYLEIDCTNAHRALADAEVTHLCYEKIRNLVIEGNIPYENPNDVFEDKDFEKPAPKKFVDFSQKQVKFKELAATTTLKKIDEDFYKKSFVFTGNLENFTRNEACKIILEGGGFVKSGVTKCIDYLIKGEESFISTKLDKANELISQGHKIKIIDEKTFLEMIYNNR